MSTVRDAMPDMTSSMSLLGRSSCRRKIGGCCSQQYRGQVDIDGSGRRMLCAWKNIVGSEGKISSPTQWGKVVAGSVWNRRPQAGIWLADSPKSTLHLCGAVRQP